MLNSFADVGLPQSLDQYYNNFRQAAINALEINARKSEARQALYGQGIENSGNNKFMEFYIVEIAKWFMFKTTEQGDPVNGLTISNCAEEIALGLSAQWWLSNRHLFERLDMQAQAQTNAAGNQFTQRVNIVQQFVNNYMRNRGSNMQNNNAFSTSLSGGFGANDTRANTGSFASAPKPIQQPAHLHATFGGSTTPSPIKPSNTKPTNVANPEYKGCTFTDITRNVENEVTRYVGIPTVRMASAEDIEENSVALNYLDHEVNTHNRIVLSRLFTSGGMNDVPYATNFREIELKDLTNVAKYLAADAGNPIVDVSAETSIKEEKVVGNWIEGHGIRNIINDFESNKSAAEIQQYDLLLNDIVLDKIPLLVGNKSLNWPLFVSMVRAARDERDDKDSMTLRLLNSLDSIVKFLTEQVNEFLEYRIMSTLACDDIIDDYDDLIDTFNKQYKDSTLARTAFKLFLDNLINHFVQIDQRSFSYRRNMRCIKVPRSATELGIILESKDNIILETRTPVLKRTIQTLLTNTESIYGKMIEMCLITSDYQIYRIYRGYYNSDHLMLSLVS